MTRIFEESRKIRVRDRRDGSLRHVFRVLAAGVMLVAAAGCFQSRATGDAVVLCRVDAECPPPLQCVPSRGACFSAQQIAGETCGDGFLSASGSEGCDDGDDNSDVAVDGCRTDCQPHRCGDGVVDRDETCDDGNTSDDDACPATCLQAICGDGLVAPNEVCDDENRNSGDGCRSDCLKIESCGDGAVDVGEECDDDNENPHDGCNACHPPRWTLSLLTGLGPEGGQGSTTALSSPSAVAVAPDGALYISDTGQNRIVRVDVDGSLVVFAGGGPAGFAGDGGPASAARLHAPGAIAVDGFGRVVFIDDAGHRVRAIDLDGTISTIAGNGRLVGGSCTAPRALDASLEVSDVAFDADGNALVADLGCDRVQRVETDGRLTCIAGCGGFDFYDGDDLRQAGFATVGAIQHAADGSLVVVDVGAQRVIRAGADGIGTVVAGGGDETLADGVRPTSARLFDLRTALFDGDDRLVLVFGDAVWRTDGDGRLRRVVGGGVETPAPGSAATSLALQRVVDVEVLRDGGLVVVDADLHRAFTVREGVVTEVIGTGVDGFSGEGGPATSARLVEGSALASTADGRGIVVDATLRRVFVVEVDGTWTSFVGGGTRDPPCTADEVFLYRPISVAVMPDGALIVLDDNRLLRIEFDGAVSLLGGLGETPVDEAPLVADADLGGVVRIVAMPDGDLWMLDVLDARVLRLGTEGRVYPVTALSTGDSPSGDGGPIEQVRLLDVNDIAVAPDGNVFVFGAELLWSLGVDGIARILAGGGDSNDYEGLPARDAFLYSAAVAVDARGAVVLAVGPEMLRLEDDGRFTVIAGGVGPVFDGVPARDADIGVQWRLQRVDDALWMLANDGTRVRALSADGILSTVVGREPGLPIGPFARAALPAASAAVRVDDDVFVGTETGSILRADLDHGVVSLVSGVAGGLDVVDEPSRADRTAPLPDVAALAYDGASTVYVASARGNRLLRLDLVQRDDPTTWTLASFAGGDAGFVDGPLATARFRAPSGLDVKGHGLLVADRDNHAIRAIDLQTGTTSTWAGGPGRVGFAGDGGRCERASLFHPEAVRHDVAGGFVFADTGNHRVWRADAGGICSTVLGDGTASDAGVGAPSRLFPTASPRALAIDPFDNVVVVGPRALRVLAADTLVERDNDRVGVVDGTGRVTTIFDAARVDVVVGAGLATRARCLQAVLPAGDDAFDVVDGCAGSLLRLQRTALHDP